MDSSLSIVPPVIPKPLPLNFATGIPRAAIIGVTTSVTLSPTPPVECLSILKPSIDVKSMTSPDSIIAFVK